MSDILKVSHDQFKERLDRSQVEQWAINSTVHHNAWATLQSADFSPVMVAFQNLIGSFICSACGGFSYVIPRKGNAEEVRCDCGAAAFNLKKKA